MKKYICLAVMIFLSLSIITGIMYSRKADEIFVSEVVVTPYTEKQQLIFEKLDELGRLRAQAAAVWRKVGLSAVPDVRYEPYEVIKAQIELLRGELIELGAKPDDELLASLGLGELERLSDAFDIWGIAHTMNAPDGAFDTYELIITDKTDGARLFGVNSEKNTTLGYELFHTRTAVCRVMYGTVGGVLFSETAKAVSTDGSEIVGIYEGYRFFEALKSSADFEITGELTFGEGGLSKNYELNACAVNSVRFIFVKPHGGEAWRHTFTTNTAYVKTEHNWSFMFFIGRRPKYAYGDAVYEYAVKPPRFENRLIYAVSSYRVKRSPSFDMIERYDFDVKRDDRSERAFSLEIPCPRDKAELIGAADRK